MNYFNPYPLCVDDSISGAWESQLDAAVKTPSLAELLAQRGGRLHFRFVAAYSELRSLPRGARRALQRRLAHSRELSAILQEWLQQQSGRALQQKLARSLAGAALLLALGREAQAATITVNTTNPHIVSGDNKCSLMEAIINANNDAQTHADCPAGAGPDTIVLPKGNHTVKVPNIPLSTALPPILSEIVIEGNGAKISRSKSAPAASIVVVTVSGDLTLRNVTLSGGYARNGGGVNNFGILRLENSTLISGNAAAYGGGVSNSYGGTATIDNSTITKNTALLGGGAYNYTGTLTITNSTISGNTASATNYSGGGGIFNNGSLSVTNSRIDKNSAKAGSFAVGGGIDSFGGNATVVDTTISGNTAMWGGGVYNYPATTITIANSTLVKNAANANSSNYGQGGGIANRGAATVINSTISGNTAGDYGGAVYNGYGNMTIHNVTITKNQAKSPSSAGGIDNFNANLVLKRTLISGNKATGSPGPELYHNGGIVTADNFNLFGANNIPGVFNFTPGVTDIVPAAGVKTTKILSSALASNGGPTQTHALVAGSPAINVAPADADCPAADQRGTARPVGGACDIGSFEGPP